MLFAIGRKMRIYFAMDLLNGEVVRAFRGDREGYGPIHLSSRVLKRSDLFYTVKTIKPRYLYIADLDRIMGKGDNKKKIEEISKEVKHLIADCGFRNPSELDEIEFDPVLGTETFNVRLLSKVKKGHL
jgi:phosphoribosylformimino-5-aminoimidazole carboxamide ribotide isomerase